MRGGGGELHLRHREDVLEDVLHPAAELGREPIKDEVWKRLRELPNVLLVSNIMPENLNNDAATSS